MVPVEVSDVELLNLSCVYGVVDCQEEVEQIAFLPLEDESVFPV